MLFLVFITITKEYMNRFSGALLFFVFLSPLLIVQSCGEANNDVIPDVSIDFTIDLLDPEFVGLTAIGAVDTIDSSTNNWGFRSSGYDNNGIIIYSGPDEYYAFDRTCPHDFSENGLSVKVNVDASLAVCPVCGTSYALSAYGTPLSGPGRLPLKNYRTSFDGERYIRVWNN